MWNYYKDKLNDDANNIVVNRRLKNNKTTTNEISWAQDRIIGRKPAKNDKVDIEGFVPLKYLTNFWGSLDLHYIKCEWRLICVIPGLLNNNDVPANQADRLSITHLIEGFKLNYKIQ